MNPKKLPVYEQRQKIVKALRENQVIVVESPTGSGKTTQLPIILYEEGFASKGIIGVTQPRRIAAVSVSDFIARQLGTTIPDIIGYKMRFEDKTGENTRIKIMTDGILLQEFKADYMLSKYSVIMVDEAHERSLNIDFILGLLKKVLEHRTDFKVIISSATINAEIFSEYFGKCPVVHIETIMYPVGIIYDPPDPQTGHEELLIKIIEIISRIVNEKRKGDILIFLSGEQSIKDCITLLYSLPFRKKLFILPLYGRLSKEEQEKVFTPTPEDKIKIVVATNIAETSVTIDGITSVIDSGLAKINFYNPKTFTSSLIENPISRASCNQRKGRAGRTQPGNCYRLYTKKDYESRPLFTQEEIYRTDLSEVVLRMAEIGITDFESFDFISPPNRQGIIGAVETLRLLDALDEDRFLSNIGKMMAAFPLLPRHSRMIVEAILKFPEVLEETIIAAAFLSTNSPFLLPAGEEITARKAHHSFRDSAGDFVSYLNLFKSYQKHHHKDIFCEKNYLDPIVMAEIANITTQLEEMVNEMGIPILSGGSTEAYLCAVSKGLLQFVCAHSGKGTYKSLTAERIQIHPGSVMFRDTPELIVAGEIVRTSRMYARSVSPLKREWLYQISPVLPENLLVMEKAERRRKKVGKEIAEPWQIRLGNEVFALKPYRGNKRIAVLPWEKIVSAAAWHKREPVLLSNIKGTIIYRNYEILTGEKLSAILKIIPWINPEKDLLLREQWNKGYASPEQLQELCDQLSNILKLVVMKKKKPLLGFVALYTDGIGRYWFKSTRGFHTALSQSLASLEILADELENNVDSAHKAEVNAAYRRLAAFFDR
ncbi:MAG: ATP-dependent RNA helicase [Spirochaetota bacterium]